jgi:hypothetical protein
LLSRDFSVFGFAPEWVLNIYPFETFAAAKGYAYLGRKCVVDLVTFHWVHWILPVPGTAFLRGIQWLATGLCMTVVLFGRGPRHLFAILAFVSLTYLWGFLWRTGADVDAVFIHFQIALLYLFFREPESLIFSRNRAAISGETPGNGAFYSLVILVFATYYFYSGVNKLVDISLSDWMRYDLLAAIRYQYELSLAGYYRSVLPIFPVLDKVPMLVALFVPFVYLMELSIPLMFFHRRLVPYYMGVFIIFHVMTWAVGIFFLGNVVIWLAFIPVRRA